MTNIRKHAEVELDILASISSDALILPFRKEILALCEAFGKSGQSGGSAPYTATAISQAVKKLMLFEPICDITGHENEWNCVGSNDLGGDNIYQNKRCSALFKNGEDAKAYYLDAIVWKGKEDWDMFTGNVYTYGTNGGFELISSRQYVKEFPFKPKTFYIDVMYIPVPKEFAEERNLHYSEDKSGKCAFTFVQDPKQLDIVFKYYDKFVV